MDAAAVLVAADADAGRAGSARQSDRTRAVTDMAATLAVVHAAMGRAGAAKEAVRERGCSRTRTGSFDPVSSSGPACGTATPTGPTAGHATCPGWIPALRRPPRFRLALPRTGTCRSSTGRRSRPGSGHQTGRNRRRLRSASPRPASLLARTGTTPPRTRRTPRMPRHLWWRLSRERSRLPAMPHERWNRSRRTRRRALKEPGGGPPTSCNTDPPQVQ